MQQNRIKSLIIKVLLKIKNALAEESDATRKMLSVYYDYTLGIASKKETKHANRQFRSLIRTLGLGVMIVLPFSPLTLPIIVKLGKKFGIDVLPNSLRKKSPGTGNKSIKE